MAKEKEDELKIGEEQKEITEEPERVTPDVEADFMGLLKDYGVAEKAAKVITKHIAETGTANVFEEPKQLLEKMAKFPRHIPPVTRKNILDHWTATRNIPVPEGFEEEAELPAEELKAKKKPVSEPEKYSVDTETGAIKVASTTDKTALTWDEADKLSTKIKKDVEEREKKEAKSGEGEKESPFIMDSEGNLTVNPKAKLGGMEVLAYDALTRAQAKGETRTPLEILEEDAKRIETIRAVFGGGKEGKGLLDSVEDLTKLKTLLGADEDTKALLSAIYKKTSESGEGKGESEEVKALREKLDTLIEQQERERWDRITAELAGVKAELAKAREEGRAKDEYGIMEKALTIGDKRLGAIENLLVSRFGNLPLPMPPEEKEKLTEGVVEVVGGAEQLDQLANEIFYGT